MLKKSLIFLLLFTSIIPISYAEDTNPTSLEISLYSDGTAKTEYLIDSDPTKVRVDVELFGPPFSNLVVRDENGNPLNYTLNAETVTINSIGAIELNIQYITFSLTAKYGSLWELNISSPVETKINLPLGASIVDFQSFPTNIGINEGRTYIEFEAGELSLYYILGLPSIAVEANEAYEEANTYITEKISDGYLVNDAITLLNQAESLIQQGSYSESINIAESALQIAKDIVNDADSAEDAINRAQSAISQSESEGRTSKLDAARIAYESSIERYDDGDYQDSEAFANQAYQMALQSTSRSNNSTTILLSIIFLITTAVGGYLYYQRNKKGIQYSEPTMQKTVHIDINQIFKEHDLRLEDREVVRFIAETNGEAFASEIRDRFEMPRSTTWRLIQRLKDLEIIEEVMVGNQSLLRINVRYQKETD